MNISDMARALSLARKPDGSFVLGDRVRQKCPGWATDFETTHHEPLPEDVRGYGCDCGGSGYITRLLIEEECPCLPAKGCASCIIRNLNDKPHTHENCLPCGGTRVVYRIDESLLREALEEAGGLAWYDGEDKWWDVQISGVTQRGTTLALAAMQALRVEMQA